MYLVVMFALIHLTNLAQYISTGNIIFTPIEHASFVITTTELCIMVDPDGDSADYADFPSPDIILITHMHGDHYNKEMIDFLKKENTSIIGPEVFIKEYGSGKRIDNNQNYETKDVNIIAIPMYNITEERKMFHQKGVGNGYVLEISDNRIYIAGDTEDINERKSKFTGTNTILNQYMFFLASLMFRQLRFFCIIS